MSVYRHLMLAACCGLLAACTAERDPADLPIARDDGRLEWQGSMACADCDAIETRLVLERAGDVRRYDLVETFHAADGGVRFADTGEWRVEADTLALTSERGALRRYALLPNGGLQPRDEAGKPFGDAGRDVLMPVEVFAP